MLLLPDDVALATRLLARLAALDDQPIQLEELTHDRLPLQARVPAVSKRLRAHPAPSRKPNEPQAKGKQDAP